MEGGRNGGDAGRARTARPPEKQKGNDRYDRDVDKGADSDGDSAVVNAKGEDHEEPGQENEERTRDRDKREADGSERESDTEGKR